MNIKILQAGNGDSILVNFSDKEGNSRNILIDGGNNYYEYKNNLKIELLEILDRKENIELLIITHTDQDHIKGIEYLLKDTAIDCLSIKKIWFNSFYPENENLTLATNNDISFVEACNVQKLIDLNKIIQDRNISVETNKSYDVNGVLLTILSPFSNDLEKLKQENKKEHPNLDISSTNKDYDYTIKELIEKNLKIFKNKNEDLDTKLENRTSIAFLLEYNSKSILFLGDANADVVSKNLTKLLILRNLEALDIDYIKLSHHASHRSLSFELLELINCNNFIVSTNGKKANLPNKLTFSKILSRPNKNGTKDCFIFNYPDFSNNLNFNVQEKEDFNFECMDANFANGFIIKI
jgi:beta-lactamase superfamily II metal-dependent hydrolase